MKRLANYLTLLATLAFTFTSCEDVPAPYGEIVPPTDGGQSVNIEPSGTGTATDPYNVAATLEFIATLGSDTPSDKEIYIKGYAVELTDISAQYGNATFTMSDNADGTANKFTVYRALGLNNEKVTDGSFIKEGDLVVICGKVTNYKGNTPETVQGAAYVYSVNGQGGSGGGTTPATGDAKGTGTQADPFNIAAAIAKCKEVGETASSQSYYVRGIATADYTVDSYKNATVDLVDAEGSSDTFTAFRVKGPDSQNLKEGYKIPKGATIIVYGPVVNFKGNTPETATGAYLVSVNGQAPEVEGGGSTPATGEPKGTGTQGDPFNVAAIINFVSGLSADVDTKADYYVKGIVTEIPNDGLSTKYNNATFYISDDASASNKFYVFRAKGLNGGDVTADLLKVGDEVLIFGSTWVNYKGTTPETKQGEAYVVWVKPGTGGGSTGGDDYPTSLSNGDFETWADGQPTGWKSASTASSATLAQSTDAHGGSYSVIVKGDEGSNKRLASQEIKLAPGTYTFSFYAKATTSDAAQVRPGVVPVADGKAGSYGYGDYGTLNNNGWTQVTHEFTLEAETTVCLVVMNPKKSNYSAGKDVLIDDATLTKK